MASRSVTGLQASLLAQVPIREKSRADYHTEWDAWANDNPVFYENRAVAVERLKSWLDNNDPHALLDLSFLGLTSLPENLPASVQILDISYAGLTRLPNNLPASLQTLNIAHNSLSSLPESLPASLQTLNAAHNPLRYLPRDLPASLQTLNVRNNRLTVLPRDLPASLQTLDAAHNLLVGLPQLLPSSLRTLSISNNRLTSLPHMMLHRLQPNCEVDLEFNPLSNGWENIHQEANAVGYSGPRIRFSMAVAAEAAENAEAAPARRLADAVSDWYPESDRDKIKATWGAFSNEQNADQFSRFAERLHATVNSSNPEFRQQVVEWMNQLATRPQLRRDTFGISMGATTSCEDRVSLTFNTMTKERLASDVKNGDYDHRLPDLIALAKGMFRLDKLEIIAQEKVKSLNFVDEVEVYLAYQVKLREPLNLPVDTPDMRFFHVSYVTEDDLKKAETDIKELEKTGFVSYLTTDWKPWQSVLQRLDPTRHEETEAKLRASEPEADARIHAELKTMSLENDSDAHRNVSLKIWTEIAHEINKAATGDFLKARNLSHLLEPQ